MRQRTDEDEKWPRRHGIYVGKFRETGRAQAFRPAANKGFHCTLYPRRSNEMDLLIEMIIGAIEDAF